MGIVPHHLDHIPAVGHLGGRLHFATRADALARQLGITEIDPQAIFGNDRPIWLEVGFGGGEHMVHMAATYPDINIIGCEPFINGVAMLLGKIRSAGVTNVSVHPGDARDLMDVQELRRRDA